MVRPLVGNVQACADPIELANADGTVQRGRQKDFQGVGWGVGMGLTIGDDPVLDRRKDQPGVPMALILKRDVPGGGNAGLPAKDGGT